MRPPARDKMARTGFVRRGLGGIDMKKTAYLIALALGFGLALSGCGKKGAAEKAGESIDRTGDKIHDAVTPDGPAEKAGKKVDRAVDDVKR
jgi:predicted small secreted protein